MAEWCAARPVSTQQAGASLAAHKGESWITGVGCRGAWGGAGQADSAVLWIGEGVAADGCVCVCACAKEKGVVHPACKTNR